MESMDRATIRRAAVNSTLAIGGVSYALASAGWLGFRVWCRKTRLYL